MNVYTLKKSNYRREWLNTFIDDVFLIPAQVLFIKKRIKTWLEENKTKLSVLHFICTFFNLSWFFDESAVRGIVCTV